MDMAKRRTDSHCFAPGCRTGYPGAPKASLFAAPRDDSLRSKWERNLRRADKSLTESSAVCGNIISKRIAYCAITFMWSMAWKSAFREASRL
ncbi:hypothetical protein MRX96_024958 [Rhipicephalus microplus]